MRMHIREYDKDVPTITTAREFIQHALHGRPGLQKAMFEKLDRIEAGQPPRPLHPELDAQFENICRHFRDAA